MGIVALFRAAASTAAVGFGVALILDTPAVGIVGFALLVPVAALALAAVGAVGTDRR